MMASPDTPEGEKLDVMVTLKMIWNLHKGLGIPAESLIKPPQAHA